MHETYKKWLDDGCPKVICSCGCNQEIIIKNHHKYQGIPKNIHYHGLIAWNKYPYPPIFDLCQCGCNEIVYNGNKFIHGHDLRVYENPMKNPEIVQKFMGDKNPAKRPEVREKISKANKGRKLSEEHINKLIEINTGKKLTEEHKTNIGTGVKNSEKYQNAIKNPERKKRMSESQKGHIGYMKGKHHSLETKEKMRESAYNRSTLEYIEKISNTISNLWNNDEYREKQKIGMIEGAKKISIALKGKLPSNHGYGKGSYYESLLQGKIWLRSSYELKFAEYLDKNNIPWLYEIQTFDLENTTYTPDFYLPTSKLFKEFKVYMRK